MKIVNVNIVIVILRTIFSSWTIAKTQINIVIFVVKMNLERHMLMNVRSVLRSVQDWIRGHQMIRV